MIEPKFKKLFDYLQNNKITKETPEDIKKLNQEYVALKKKADNELIKL
nr:hypothetical protein [uncultured Tyzzerella sp.]